MRSIGHLSLAWLMLGSFACAGISPTPTSAASVQGTPAELNGAPATAEQGARRQQNIDTTLAEAASAPPPQGGFGSGAPTQLIAASPAMNWVALCQARQDTNRDQRISVTLGAHGEFEGDAMRPYLVEGSGKGMAIDRFVGHDPTGRYVAFVQQGELILRDTKKRINTNLGNLGADARSDQSSFREDRAASFDPLGRYVSYIRRQGPRTWVILRELSSGKETPVDPGAGVLWRAEFEPGGEFLRLSVTTEDTNGNRQLGWHSPPALTANADCRAQTAAFNVRERPGDSPTILLYHLKSQQSIRVANFIATNGSSYLYRTESGEVWQRSPIHPKLKIASKECGAKILHIDDLSGSVLFGCSPSYGGRRVMFLRTAHKRSSLKLNLAPYEVDGRLPHNPELLILNPHDEAYLLNVSAGSLTPLKAKTKMLASYQGTVLAHHAGALRWINKKGETKPLKLKRPPLAQIQQTGRFVSLGPLLFDLTVPSAPARFAATPLALSASGHGLFPKSVKGAVPLGPLRWHKAR